MFRPFSRDSVPSNRAFHRIPVKIDGSLASSIAAVQLCADEDGCSSGVPVQGPQQPTGTPSPPSAPDSLTAPAEAPSDSTGAFSHFITSRLSDKNWEIETNMVQPAGITAQALGDDGAILARTEAALEWTRTGGSEECGGPARSTPIRLDTGI